MTTVFFVRHGEVEGNSGERRTFAGWGDKPLTVRGQRQAEKIAERLAGEKVAAVYASDLQRACLTAGAIAGRHGLQAVCDKALREVHYGEWEDRSVSEIESQWSELWRRRVADPVGVAPPGGESYADLWARVQPCFEAILARHTDDNVVIVGHNGSLRVMLCHLMGTSLDYARRIRLSNCGLSRVDIDRSEGQDEEGIIIMFLNETYYLEGV